MELLDYLAEETHCEFMSDLHYSSKKPSDLRKIIENVSLSVFPEKEWIDTAEYICGVQCKSAGEAKRVLATPKRLFLFR